MSGICPRCGRSIGVGDACNCLEEDAAALLVRLKDKGFAEEHLDVVVHEVHNQMAADINNDGMEVQVMFLLKYGLSDTDIEKRLTEGA